MNTIIVALLLIILILITGLCVLGTVASRANDAKARAQRALSEHIRYHAIERGELKADITVMQNKLRTANYEITSQQSTKHELRRQLNEVTADYKDLDVAYGHLRNEMDASEDEFMAEIRTLVNETIDLRLECSNLHIKNADLQQELNELRWTEVQDEENGHKDIPLNEEQEAQLMYERGLINNVELIQIRESYQAKLENTARPKQDTNFDINELCDDIPF